MEDIQFSFSFSLPRRFLRGFLGFIGEFYFGTFDDAIGLKLILPLIHSINSRFLVLILPPLVLDYLGFGCDVY